MIKVLYVTDNLRQRFGVTSVIMNYLECINDRDISIDILCYEDSEEEVITRATNSGARVLYMPKLGIKNVHAFSGFLNTFFASTNYDVVHSHFNQIDSLLFPIARRNGVKACISHSHSTKLSNNCIKAIRNRIMCWNISWNADVLAACSEKAGIALYGRKFLKAPNCLVIKNGINIEKFKYDENNRREIRNEYHIDNDEILIGHVGSFTKGKNQKFLIDTLKELCVDYNRYHLLLVGGGDTFAEVKEYVKMNGLQDNVIFTGVRNDVNKILSAIDIFAMPSLHEGLPVIGIEAQASGVQCLFSDQITKELNIVNARFLSINNPKLWADVIGKIGYEIYRDKDAGSKVREAGYDIAEAGKTLGTVYKKCIGPK